jgi:hypothetical protein
VLRLIAMAPSFTSQRMGSQLGCWPRTDRLVSATRAYCTPLMKQLITTYEGRWHIVKKHVLQCTLLAGTVGYLIAIATYFTPPSWGLSPFVVFVLCPAALASFTVDPSLTTVASILAPVNALLYGGAGLVIGLCTRGRRPHAICVLHHHGGVEFRTPRGPRGLLYIDFRGRNAFLSTSDPKALQAAADKLRAATLVKRLIY